MSRERSPKWSFWLGSLGLLLLAVPFLYLGTRPPAPAVVRDPSGMTRITANPGLNLYPTLSPDGRSVAYTSERGNGFELIVSGPDGRETQLTADGQHNVQPSWSPDGQTIAYHSRGRKGIWLVPAAGGPPRQLTTYGARPAWSPDGKRIALQSESQAELEASWTAIGPLPPSVIWIVPVDGGPPVRVTKPGDPAGGHGSPTFTPRGDRVVFVSYDRARASLWFVAPDGSALEQALLPADQPMVSDPASCAGCDSVFYVSSSEKGSSGIWRLRVDARERGPEWVRSQLVGPGLQRVRHLTLSRDGRRLAYAAVSVDAQLASLAIDPVTGLAVGEPKLLTSGIGRSSRPQFSPDGRLIAFSLVRPDSRSDVWISEPDGRNARALTIDPATDTMPSWFPDSRRVAFLSDRSGHAAVWVSDVEVGTASLLVDLKQSIDAPRISPDGTLLAFSWSRGGKTMNTWVVPVAGGEPRAVTADPELMAFPAWSPDGRHLAVQTKRGGYAHVAVVPLASRSNRAAGEPAQLTEGATVNWAHSFGPDGDRIAFAGARDGIWNVYWVSRSTRKQQQVTSNRKIGSYVRYPAWSPRGDQLVYEYADATGAIWTVDEP